MHQDSATSDFTDIVDQIPSTITEEMASQVTTATPEEIGSPLNTLTSQNTRIDPSIDEISSSLTINISTGDEERGVTLLYCSDLTFVTPLKVSSATIGPSKSQDCSDKSDLEAENGVTTDNGVEIMRKY